jgi:hypothetical protein
LHKPHNMSWCEVRYASLTKCFMCMV